MQGNASEARRWIDTLLQIKSRIDRRKLQGEQDQEQMVSDSRLDKAVIQEKKQQQEQEQTLDEAAAAEQQQQDEASAAAAGEVLSPNSQAIQVLTIKLVVRCWLTLIVC